MAVAVSAFAAGGTGQYGLPWNVDGQVLEYHSCGCADSCWKAEVRSTRTKAVLATLRCDCEHLYFSTTRFADEQQVPRACTDLDDKPTFIRQMLEELLAREVK